VDDELEIYRSRYRSLEAYYRAREAEAQAEILNTTVAVGAVVVGGWLTYRLVKWWFYER
jgi:hypothetical protein